MCYANPAFSSSVGRGYGCRSSTLDANFLFSMTRSARGGRLPSMRTPFTSSSTLASSVCASSGSARSGRNSCRASRTLPQNPVGRLGSGSALGADDHDRGAPITVQDSLGFVMAGQRSGRLPDAGPGLSDVGGAQILGFDTLDTPKFAGTRAIDRHRASVAAFRSRELQQ